MSTTSPIRPILLEAGMCVKHIVNVHIVNVNAQWVMEYTMWFTPSRMAPPDFGLIRRILKERMSWLGG
jgi:hypothetical protein